MKVKTAQVLQIIATILYLIAFIAGVVSIFFQQEIKELFTPDAAVINYRSVPYASLIISLVFLLLAVIYLILVLSVKSRGGSIASVIIMSILTIVLWVGMETAGRVFVNYLVAAEGATALASYSLLENAVSTASKVLMIPATALMFLSMGGFQGKPYKEKTVKEKAPEKQRKAETHVPEETIPFPAEEVVEPTAVEISVIPESYPGAKAEAEPVSEVPVSAAPAEVIPETPEPVFEAVIPETPEPVFEAAVPETPEPVIEAVIPETVAENAVPDTTVELEMQEAFTEEQQ